MSNFAERLVARAAGAPVGPGISVLAPRPISRFEPAAAVDIETILDAEHPLAAPAAPAAELQTHPAAPAAELQTHPAARRASIESPRSPRLPRETSPAIVRPSEDGARMPDHDAIAANPAARTGLPRMQPPEGREQQQRRYIPNPAAREGTPVREGAPKVDSDSQASHFSPPPPAEQVSPRPIPDRTHKIQIFPAGQHAADPLAQPAAVHHGKAGQPPAPAISIGKIEVQFLPREPQVPLPRPPPERTRGFAAYARARRGEPR